MQIQHRREAENPFTGGDLGQVTARPHVRPLWLAEVPTERVGALRADLSRLVVDRRECFALASRCCSAITAATVFSLIRHPRSRRSADRESAESGFVDHFVRCGSAVSPCRRVQTGTEVDRLSQQRYRPLIS
jgi:hypothetical protein